MDFQKSEEILTFKIMDVEIKIKSSQSIYYDKKDPFFRGFKLAISEYLCYPYSIIESRLNKYSRVDFEYDKKALISVDAKTITTRTKEQILEYLYENPDKEDILISKYIVNPFLSKELCRCWCDKIKQDADSIDVKVKKYDKNDFSWIEFTYNSSNKQDRFYGRYIENAKKTDILLISLPGYRAEWNDLSAYKELECDVLQISPLGYNTPQGYNNSKLINGAWPVLYDTVSEIDFYLGYNKWFLECSIAINSIKKENQKLMFIGTSQGGGAAMILSSMYNDITVGVAAEMPFFIGFSNKNYEKVYSFVSAFINTYEKPIYKFYAQERLYCIDPINHTNRINSNVLLVSGEKDTECPPGDIYEMYEKLQCPKKYVELKNIGHGYTKEFENIANRWLKNLM